MVESLEVRRRRVAERRVDPAGVVEALDEAEDFTPRVRRRRKAASVEELALQRREEALAHRVVVGVADRAHRLHDARFTTALSEGQRRILRALDALMFVKWVMGR